MRGKKDWIFRVKRIDYRSEAEIICILSQFKNSTKLAIAWAWSRIGGCE